MAPEDITPAMLQASGGRNPLDVAFVDGGKVHTPWESLSTAHDKITGPLPSSLTLVLANEIYIEKKDIPQPLLNRIIRLAAFPNLNFIKLKPCACPCGINLVICCADNFLNI